MTSRDEFEASLADLGFGEPWTASFEPGLAGELHTHDEDTYLLVLDGEFGLVLGEGEDRFVAGETCLLPAGSLHVERGGPDGATVLLARRPPAATGG